MTESRIVIALILSGLFAIAIIGFAANFATDNNSPVDISNDAEFSEFYSGTTNNVSNFEEDSESQYASILETTIEPESGAAPSTGPFAVTYKNAFNIVTNIMGVAYIKIFGSSKGFGIFLTSFSAIILFLLGLFVYKTLRGLP